VLQLVRLVVTLITFASDVPRTRDVRAEAHEHLEKRSISELVGVGIALAACKRRWVCACVYSTERIYAYRARGAIRGTRSWRDFFLAVRRRRDR